MIKLLRAAIVAALFACAPIGTALAQQPAALAPSGNTTLAVSTTSNRVALPTGDATAWVRNTGSADARFRFGTATVVATTSDILLKAGESVALSPGVRTHIAAITAAGSTNLEIVTGTGQPSLANPGGSGGGGGGGAVTVADGADLTQGAVADAACSTDTASCSIAAILKRSNVLRSSGNASLTQIDADLGAAGDTACASGSVSCALIPGVKALVNAAQDTTPVATVPNVGTAGTGITAPTGGSGLLGFLSGVFDRLGSVLQVGGNVGHNVPDSGNPVKMGCVYRATPPNIGDQRRGDVRCGPSGEIAVYFTSPSNSYAFAQVQPPGNGVSAGNSALGVFDGILNNKAGGSAALDAKCSIPAQAAARTGACIQAVAQAATNDAGQAIPRTVSGTSAAAGMQLCSAACNLFGLTVTATAAGYVIIYDQTTAPADGTATWAVCRQIPAGSTTLAELRSAPARFTTGAYAVKSSTGCGTKTAVTDAFFESYAVQ